MSDNQNIYWLHFRAFESYRLVEDAVECSLALDADSDKEAEALAFMQSRAENLQKRNLKLRTAKFLPARRRIDRIEYTIIKNGTYINGKIDGPVIKSWTWHAPSDEEILDQAVAEAWRMTDTEEVES